jgi:ligand-binding SRPBCC domain-containing protein
MISLLDATWSVDGGCDNQPTMVQIDQCIQIAAPIERCFDLARSIEVHLLGTAKSGEQAVAGVTTGLIGPGQFVRWRAKHLGVRQHLTTKITAFERPHYFQDTMIQGAFKLMRHDHFFASIAANRTEMKDRFFFAAPFPVLGLLAERLLLRSYMANLLRQRNSVLKEVAKSEKWADFLPPT